MCVTLGPWQRECAGFNKRVCAARRHPLIIVIVDRSSTSLCAAGNHGGQDFTSDLHAPPVQHTAYFKIQSLSSNTLHGKYCRLFLYKCTSFSLFLTVSIHIYDDLSSRSIVFPDVSLFYCPYIIDCLLALLQCVKRTNCLVVFLLFLKSKRIDN